ncbi:glycerol-3-phosphate 1-O-acyltransferase PlsY [Methylibium sp.]|uniref:glycerol-3-phosphate 1-O-acyltransferase PlsY n=1 Tax=Methylibium sp. TaxID=2067992 RepID=UPI0017D33A87|nr:glycerol-3-phosphate 1-O-acyltransferase PlsY [Methylibium sp.]MBA3588635.1 glycerol-3-phosphate 1-O-acyltransferase PlsY [Methylibium sp.]
MPFLYPALAVVAAYLVGSVSFGVIVSRGFGLPDPRTYGSGNPGATNVLRSGKKAAAILTLVLDAAKGALPVWAVQQFGADHGLGQGTVALIGLAAFVGHLWPVFFGFKGGKGVATAAGVLLALNPFLALATLASFAIILFFFRYVSLASIVAAAFAPFYQLLIWRPGPLAAVIVVMSVLLIWRHSANIQKLLAGTERKFGEKTKAVGHTPAKGRS